MKSSRPSASSRPRLVARLAAAALGALLVAGCYGESAIDEAGATLSGRIRLAPLREAPPAGMTTVQILPFSGLPVTIADGIYRAFRSAAETEGVTLVHRLEEPATWRVQGHYVALGHSTTTTVIYTWDIYDAGGRPVHRIIGQEVTGGAEGDAWAAVESSVQTRLAQRALRDLKAWLKRNPG